MPITTADPLERAELFVLKAFTHEPPMHIGICKDDRRVVTFTYYPKQGNCVRADNSTGESIYVSLDRIVEEVRAANAAWPEGYDVRIFCAHGG